VSALSGERRASDRNARARRLDPGMGRRATGRDRTPAPTRSRVTAPAPRPDIDRAGEGGPAIGGGGSEEEATVEMDD
jgi:hypothetical protein